MKDLNEDQWSFNSSLSIDKQLEDSNSTSRTTSSNLSTTEEEAESKFVRTDHITDEGLDQRSLKHLCILKFCLIFSRLYTSFWV